MAVCFQGCFFFFFFFFLSRDDALRLTARSKPVTSANYTGQNWFWGVSAFNKSDVVSWRCLLFYLARWTVIWNMTPLV